MGKWANYELRAALCSSEVTYLTSSTKVTKLLRTTLSLEGIQTSYIDVPS